MSIAKVKILSGDGLPNSICEECVDKLEMAYRFKLQIEEADDILREKSNFVQIKEDKTNVNDNVQNSLENLYSEDEDESEMISEVKDTPRTPNLVPLDAKKQNTIKDHDYRFENPSNITDELKNMADENYFENMNLSSRLNDLKSTEKSSQVFMCYLCDQNFTTKELLKKHMPSHEEVKKIASLSKPGEKFEKLPQSGKCQKKCPFCDKEYLYVNSYSKHIKQCAKENEDSKPNSMPLEITFQEKDNSIEFDLEQNIIMESEIGEIACNEDVYGELDTMDEEEKLSKEEPNQVGSELDDKAESRKNIRQHFCKLCNRYFSKGLAFNQHMTLHQKQKSFKCTQCNKCYSNELTLRNHLTATDHKTIIYGKEYNLHRRVTRVAAKTAQEVIEQLKADNSDSEDHDFDPDYQEDEQEEAEEVEEEFEEKFIIKKEDEVEKTASLPCGICDERFPSKQSLMKHAELHVLRKDPKNLQNETKDSDDDFANAFDWPLDAIHECPTCKKRYSTKKSLLRHQLLHNAPNFECDICNVKFYRKDKLKSHYDKCSERNPDQVRKCNICGETFESNAILRQHKGNHVAEGLLSDDDLRATDPNDPEDKNRKIHRKRRTDVIGLECSECDKRYSSRKGLLRHLQVHEGKKYLCDMCPKKFHRKEHLKIHVAKHNIVKPHKCNRCSKCFIKEDQLNIHLLKHEQQAKNKKPKDSDGEKRFLCEICSKSFTQSTTLVAHLRAHKGIKPYTCSVCSRPFTTNAYLKMHMRTHTQERPYICQYCSRAFARADTLSNHLTSHTGEAKYHCKYCPKNFRRLKSLKEHVFIHTGQKPYSCPTCDRKFNNNGSRYAHSKRCKQQVERRERLSKIIVGEPVEELKIEPKLISDKSAGDPQHIVSQQEILMPLLVPIMTLADVTGDQVILPECTKIFTT